MIKKFIQKKVNKDAHYSDTEIDEDYEIKEYINNTDEDNFSKK